MGMKRTYLADRAVQGSDSAVFRQDLPRTGRVSAIEIGVRITNGSTSGTEIIDDAIDRIEVLGNGSFPIKSMTGRMAAAAGALWLRRRLPQVRTQAASAVQERSYLIPFGFRVGDPVHYLELSRWQQVQLAVTFSPTIAATGFATATVTFTVKLHYWDAQEALLGSGGYIRNREIFSFTSAASGDQQILLPTEHPLLGLLVFSREAGIALETDLTRVRLLDKIGGVELYNRRTEDAQMENDEELGLEAIERGRALLADADNLDTDVNFLDAINLSLVQDLAAGADFDIINPASITGDRVAIHEAIVEGSSTYAATILETTARRVQWEAIGRGLPHAIYVPLHDWGNPESAYPAPQRDQAVLLLTQGGAGATVVVNVLELAA